MFDNIITPQFKQLFKDSINTLIAQNALTVPCTIEYENTKRNLCYNCEFDPIHQCSANMPKNGSLVSFPVNTICPVCNGIGYIDNINSELVYLAIIFDSKYFLNFGSKVVNVSDGLVQSLCAISLLPKLKEAKHIIIDNNIATYGHYRYTRAGDPQPIGLGSNDYIITMWQQS